MALQMEFERKSNEYWLTDDPNIFSSTVYPNTFAYVPHIRACKRAYAAVKRALATPELLTPDFMERIATEELVRNLLQGSCFSI